MCLGCSKQIVSTDVFTFDFKGGAPGWIQINDNQTGELIHGFTYQEPVDFVIPASHQSELYNIIFVNATSGTYLPGTVQVISMRDISPDTIGTIKIESQGSAGYLKKYYTPAEDIADFFDESKTFFEKYGFLEKSNSYSNDAFDIDFIKLNGEEGMRYFFTEDYAEGEDQNIHIYDLPKVPSFERIQMPQTASKMRVLLHGKRPMAMNYRQRIYDTYRTDFEVNRFVDYPVVDEAFEYVHQVRIVDDSKEYYIFNQGLPLDLNPLEPNFTIGNNLLSNFKVDTNDSDMAAYLFSLNNSEFHVIDDSSNGSSFVKPEFASEILAAFPELALDGELRSTYLIYMHQANGMDYQTFTLPYRRADGVYEFGNVDLYNRFDKVPFLTGIRLHQ